MKKEINPAVTELQQHSKNSLNNLKKSLQNISIEDYWKTFFEGEKNNETISLLKSMQIKHIRFEENRKTVTAIDDKNNAPSVVFLKNKKNPGEISGNIVRAAIQKAQSITPEISVCDLLEKLVQEGQIDYVSNGITSGELLDYDLSHPVAIFFKATIQKIITSSLKIDSEPVLSDEISRYLSIFDQQKEYLNKTQLAGPTISFITQCKVIDEYPASEANNAADWVKLLLIHRRLTQTIEAELHNTSLVKKSEFIQLIDECLKNSKSYSLIQTINQPQTLDKLSQNTTDSNNLEESVSKMNQLINPHTTRPLEILFTHCRQLQKVREPITRTLATALLNDVNQFLEGCAESKTYDDKVRNLANFEGKIKAHVDEYQLKMAKQEPSNEAAALFKTFTSALYSKLVKAASSLIDKITQKSSLEKLESKSAGFFKHDLKQNQYADSVKSILEDAAFMVSLNKSKKDSAKSK